MPRHASNPTHLNIIAPFAATESLYVGVDIGKHAHIAGFVSKTLLARHERFEGCPVLAFEQSREGFRSLADRIQTYVPLAQAYVFGRKNGPLSQTSGSVSARTGYFGIHDPRPGACRGPQ